MRNYVLRQAIYGKQLKYKIKRKHVMRGHDNFVVDMRDLNIYINVRELMRVELKVYVP